MEVLYPCCCGLDVHKKSITACVLWAGEKGKSRLEKRRFGTFTQDLLRLADWLRQCGVTHVAMESTGGRVAETVGIEDREKHSAKRGGASDLFSAKPAFVTSRPES